VTDRRSFVEGLNPPSGDRFLLFLGVNRIDSMPNVRLYSTEVENSNRVITQAILRIWENAATKFENEGICT
jgi:hypothetical protein